MIDRKKILFLTARLPFPLVGGDRVKPYNILKYLAKKHDVTLISFYQGETCPDDYKEALLDLGINLRIVSLDPIQAGLRAGALTLGGFPLEIGYYNNPLFSIEVEKAFKEKDFDLAFAFFMRTAEYLKKKNVKKFLMAEDCRIVYQKRSYMETKKFLQKLIRWWEYKKLLKYEVETVDKFDVTTFVTYNDIDAIKEYNDKGNYKLLSNGVDIDTFVLPISNNRKDILFAGKLDIWANVLMIDQIMQNIMPRVWNKHPDVKLKIVGANPPKSIQKYQNDKVIIIPDVPSLVPYYQEAAVFLHPHSGGTGIQNKLLEAMACGCPVLTTKTGIQGIEVIDNESVYLASTSEEFSEKVIFMLDNPDISNQIGLNSNKVILDTHSWDAIYKDLDIILEEMLNK